MRTNEVITIDRTSRFEVPTEAELQAVYGVAAETLADMKARLIVPDTSTPDGYKLAVAGIRECRELRGAVEEKRVELKKIPLEYGRVVDKVAKFLTAEIEAIEEPIKLAKKREDDRVEAEKQEAERVAREAREAVEKAAREAEEAERRAAHEAEQLRLAEERAKLEAERKAMEEAQRIERERLEAERAVIEAEQRRQREAAEAELQKQREALEAEQRRIAEQQAADARKLAEERAAVEAERRRQEEAERQRLAAIERQQREAEEAARRQQEAEEREALRLAALPEAEKLKAWLLRIRDAVESGPDTSELVVFLNDYNDCYHSIHNRQAAFREHIEAVTKGGAS